MQIAERTSQAPAVPLVLVLAIVATIVIGLAALALRPAGPAVRTPMASVTSTANLSPDAQDRNAQILAARLGKAEATHGH